MPKPLKKTHRVARVNSLIAQRLSEILREFLSEQPGLVTITKVETSADLKWAKIWLSVLGGDDKAILKILESNLYHIQGELNKFFPTKIIPRISFYLDTGPRHAEHIEQLIKKIHEQEVEEQISHDEQ